MAARPNAVIEAVSVHLLGTPRVEAAGSLVAIPRRRTRALLYFLAAEPVPHTRDELADLLWAELPAARARRQLSDALTDLRRVLGAGAVVTDAESVEWGGPPSDVTELSALLARGNRSDGAQAAEELNAAVDLYRGELLSGVRLEGCEAFDEWLEETRLRLSLDALGALARLARLRLDSGKVVGAIEAAERGLALDALREDLWRLLIEARAARGDQEGALREYMRCRDVLRRELGVAPEPETEALRRRLSAEPGSAAAGTREAAAVKARPALPFALRLPPGALPLTGRDRELGALLRRWREVSAEAGGMALIVGEPGIGKTRLAAEFVARAVASGAVVIGARCPDLADPPPYGPLEEAVRAMLPSLPAGALSALGEEWLPWAGRLVPELGLGAVAPKPLSPEEERSRLAEAAARLLEVMAGEKPLLLVIEDLHWAHPATIGLLHRLARRPWPALVLGTFRDTEPQTPGSEAIARAVPDLAAEGLLERLALGALTQEQTQALVRLALASAGSRVKVRSVALAEVSEGHPLFALELTRAVLEAPDDPEVPETLATTIRTRLDRASEQARHMLMLAAVFGVPVSPSLLAGAAGLEPSDGGLISAIEELLARRLLRESPSGELAIGHGVIASVVYDGLSVPRRRALHARVAQVFESAGEVPQAIKSEGLIRHYRLAGEPLLAANCALRAGERALALAEVDTATARYKAAAELFQRAGRDEEAADAFERAGDAVMREGSQEPAGEAFTAAIVLWESSGGSEESILRLRRKLAELYTRWGYCGPERRERATVQLEAAARLAEKVGIPDEKSRVLSARAFMLSAEGDFTGAEQDAREALHVAESDETRLQAMDALECALTHAGRIEEALAINLERVPIATRLGDAVELNDAHRMAAFRYGVLGDGVAAERHARAAEQPALKAGLHTFVLHARTGLAEALLLQGRWAEAAELAEALVADPATQTGDRPLQIPLRMLLLAEAYARLGRVEEARRLLTEAEAHPGFDPTDFFHWAGRAQERAARAIAEAGAAKAPQRRS